MISRNSPRRKASLKPDNSNTEIEQIIKELNDFDMNGGDGGDSDVGGDEVMVLEDIHTVEDKDESTETHVKAKVEGEDLKVQLKLTSTGGLEVLGDLPSDGSTGDSRYKNVKIPSPDPEWTPPEVKAKKGEPQFCDVDNPGNWNRFIFQPKFDRKGTKKYTGHFLPTGATPVPLNKDGKRVVGDWEFFYNGFKNDDMPYRHKATTTNLFPDTMKGYLDVKMLKKMGLTTRRVQEVDALFFYQLLLPMCDPDKSGIENDPRVAYYSFAEKCTNAEKFRTGTGASYGHDFKPTTAAELLVHDAILFLDGVLGKSDGALYGRWDKESSMYNEDIATAMTLTRYGELKRNKKLCFNLSNPGRGNPGYNPAYKYDLTFKCVVDNTNVISAKADETQSKDETTWGHSGYGESGTGITTKFVNKKVSCGGQVVIVMDRFRFRPRAYMHRNKIYEELYSEKKLWKKKGTFEMMYLAKQLMLLKNQNGENLFPSKPCITADNYFQDDQIMEWMGQEGFGAILTSARDRLPGDIPSQYLHKAKTLPGNKAAKLAKFVQPIVAVKNSTGPTGKYQRTHISFQSTSSCNISTVNAMNEVYNFVELRERGRGDDKRFWVIEMNHARRTYLSTYNGIDVLDHMIKNANLGFVSWKYWHAPMNHALSMAIVVAYDIYLEVCEGKLDEEWKVETPISFRKFRETFAKQALSYSPAELKYPGDENFRVATKRGSKSPPKKSTARRRPMSTVDGTFIPVSEFKKSMGARKGRSCGDLDKLCAHLNSVEGMKSARACAWCGLPCYQKCTLCEDDDGKPVNLHHNQKFETSMCFFNYHNESCLGLARSDQPLGKFRKAWAEPKKRARNDNKEVIKKAKKEHDIE